MTLDLVRRQKLNQSHPTFFLVDDEDDSEVFDMSENSSFTGQGSETDEVSDEENLAAEETNLQYQKAKTALRKFMPEGYRKGSRKMSKRGKVFGRKGQLQTRSKRCEKKLRQSEIQKGPIWQAGWNQCSRERWQTTKV